jgi:two-component system phosphate regulon response regulator PhoB
MFSILIVEQNVSLVTELQKLLSRKRYFITVCYQVSSAFDALENRQYDLVITASVLKDGEGIEIVEYLNRFSYETRCMILSTRPKYSDRIEAYKKGVDDFLVKPFNLNEFWWRFKSLCFKQKIKERNLLQLCDQVSIYPDEGLLKIEDRTTIIPKKESKILSCLLRHKTRVVGRDEITRWVWSDGEFVPKSVTLDVYIKRIRLKLGKYGEKLQTVRGFGYRIE